MTLLLTFMAGLVAGSFGVAGSVILCGYCFARECHDGGSLEISGDESYGDL